jgi:hypothetical protein
MKDAVLWRRILNEGFRIPDVGEGEAEQVANLQTKIIAATIVVDSRPMSRENHAFRLDSVIAIPFPHLWTEFQCDGTVGGSYMEHTVSDKCGHEWCNCYAFVAVAGLRPVLFAQYTMHFDNDHKVRADESEFYVVPWMSRALGEVKARGHIAYTIYAAVSTLELMSCSNVGLAPRPFDPEQVRRAAKRFGEVPGGYRYHVLVVRPPGARSSTPGQEIGTMPRHVCRGHFAEYGPQFGKGLLFGRHAGRFFIPPHLRGDEKNGIVEKDYAVAAPEGRP